MSEIQSLFNKDPREMSREDITQIIDHFRAERLVFDAKEAKPKEKRTPAVAGSANVNLEDLL